MRAHILNMHSHSMQEVIMGFPPTLENLIMNAPQVKWLTFVVLVSVCDWQCHVAHNVVHMVYRVRASLHSMHTFTRL